MINELQVKYFKKLGETLSFSRTAESFNVSRQAVSKVIASFEAYYGVPLFIRNQRRVSLSEAGKLLYNFYNEYLEHHSLIKKQLDLIKDKSPELLNVGFQDYVSFNSDLINLLQPGNMGLQKINIVVEQLSSSLLLNSLMNKLFDIILVCKRLVNKPEDVEMIEVQKMPLIVLVSSRNKKVHDEATYKEFINEPLIVNRFEGEQTSEFNRRIRKKIEFCGLNPSGIIEVPNKDSAFMALRMNKGIIICASTDKFVNIYGLQTYYTEAEDTLVCLWRKNDKNPSINDYIEYLLKIFNSKKES
jgi:DNA-binding transcriptional LysR family regulator